MITHIITVDSTFEKYKKKLLLNKTSQKVTFSVDFAFRNEVRASHPDNVATDNII